MPTRQRRFIGAQFADLDSLSAALVARTGLPAAQVTRLVDLYGSRTFQVWQLVEQRPELNRVVHPSGVLAAELVFAVDVDLARTLTDVLARRVMIAFEPDHGLESIDDLVGVLGEHLGWDDAAKAAQIDDYRLWLDKLAVPDPAGPRSESFGAGSPVKAQA